MWLEEPIFVLKVINIVQENAFLFISRHEYWKNTLQTKNDLQEIFSPVVKVGEKYN